MNNFQRACVLYATSKPSAKNQILILEQILNGNDLEDLLRKKSMLFPQITVANICKSYYRFKKILNESALYEK